MPDQSFRKTSRLLRPSEFRNVFDQTALRGSTSQLLVLATPNTLEKPRIGFVLAKKQLKRAVDRNRVKRLIRESFRLHQHDLANHDFVILARSGILELDNQQIREMIDGLWFRLRRPHGKHTGRERKARR
ncbi:MAG TPA: ribonuclease P protein component [Oceanospirillales bacterium]|nr:ribonuclease P protein component [Oceanospirillaceae bacterium]HBS42015.1 ribonuclease P protein component [Oceanospirillales bacterium]|tara:strand:+ start:98 stop:487 length:390 start_codon:yes stop_codon:yes gene_type:complete